MIKKTSLTVVLAVLPRVRTIPPVSSFFSPATGFWCIVATLETIVVVVNYIKIMFDEDEEDNLNQRDFEKMKVKKCTSSKAAQESTGE